jgi:type IV pilus assembly protein PilX
MNFRVRAKPLRQRGISLVIVLVVLMLSVLLAMGAARTALLNEALTGNLSDEQRTAQAAEALLVDAQASVQLHLNQTSNDQAADELPNTRGEAFLPISQADYSRLALALEKTSGADTPCVLGYCVLTPDPGASLGNWWADPTTLNALWPLGASYGTYTGATVPAGNAALNNARFWVEIYPFSRTVDTQTLAPSDTHPFVYQITVVARGLKAGTQVVLRSVIMLTPAS